MRSYEEAFFWLADARIANICFACSDPGVGLSLNMTQSSLKCYLADTGLLVSLAFADNAHTDESVYLSLIHIYQVVLTCPECGGRIGDERVESANLRRAYEAYREGQGLLSASQIRDAYDSYGLSQASFGKLLGLGGATLSRYENGGVQTRQIDQAIRAASDPHAMLDLLAEKGAEIPAAQRGRAEQRAREKLARGRESRFEYAVVRGDFSLVLNPACLLYTSRCV